MIGFVTRAVFGLDITERNGIIRISGIRAYDFIADIDKSFNTTRVTTHMFNKATRTYIEFYSFFAIDIEYIIRKLSTTPRTRMGRRGYIAMLEQLKLNTWLADLDKEHPSIFNKERIKEINFSLLTHQAEFIDYYDKVIPKYNLKGILMAATPGSGKTISAIAVACAYESKAVIIVSPKNAVFRVWEKTLLEDMAVKQKVWVQASGEPMPSPKDCRWFIFHYESLDKAVELSKRLTNERCTVVLDESHNLNEVKSLRTTRFVDMCQSLKQSLIVELSGTPMKAMGAEAIPLISAIDPLFTDQCAEKFKKIYGREAKAATAILANRLGIIMYRVNKEESKIAEPVEHTLNVQVPNSDRFTLEAISKDMADFIIQRTQYYKTNYSYYLGLYEDSLREFEDKGLPRLSNKATYDLYLDYVDEFKKYGYNPLSSAPKALFCNDFEKNIIIPSLTNESKKNFRKSKTVVKYVNLKIRGECLGTVLSRARTDCNLAILEHLDLASLIDDAQKKTLVFTSYVEIVKATDVKLKAQGYNPLTVFAETNSQLPAMVKQFGSDDSINPMIATYQSLSTAVPLTMANRVILLNSSFRIHEKEQTIARANRLGQDKTVDVYNIFLDTADKPNVSTRSAEILEWSRVQVNAIMGIDISEDNIATESLEEAECLVDLNNIVEELTPEYPMIDVTPSDVVTQEQFYGTDDHTFNRLMNNIVTCESFIESVNRNLDNGTTLTPSALNYYNLSNSDDTLTRLSTESMPSDVKLTVLSLEAEKGRVMTFLQKLIAFIKRILNGIANFFKNVEGNIRGNIDNATRLKAKLSKARVTNTGAKVSGTVAVDSAIWLTRGNGVTPTQYLRDLKWQLDTMKKLRTPVDNNLSKLSKDFDTTLEQIYTTPGLNHLTVILGKLAVFKNLMFDASVVSDQNNYNQYNSAPMLGGRVFTLQFPKGKTSEDILKTASHFNLRTSINENANMDDSSKIPTLNVKESHAVLDYVIELNKTLSYMHSSLAGAVKEMDAFTNKTNKALTGFKGKEDRQILIFNKQVTLMLSGFKVYTKFAKNYVNNTDRASRAGIRYVIASNKAHVDPDPS